MPFGGIELISKKIYKYVVFLNLFRYGNFKTVTKEWNIL